ncbi:MAG: aromatic ring-hydroxylating dioxygenase subunit alpha [Rhizobiales bacterium]|nr:aromatic ring-hydroxylating dioxygenase subunit alpha [Hyphomicrobiales bacterium]
MDTPDPTIAAQVKHLLGEDGYAQAFAPIDQASGLPNAAYWSEDWLALENKRIFQRSWVFVMADAQLEGPGAIKPVDVGGTPIMLVRGEDDQVRAFHNVCRHRGTQLVGEACAANTITCPYHAWAYRLDGTLKSRPHFHGPNQLERFDNGEAEDLALHPIRCETWNGCLFVDLSGQAPDLSTWLDPMLKRTSAFDFTNIRWIEKKSYTIKSNWKLVLENYMEGYHVFAAHPRLIAHAPMDVRWSGEWSGNVFYNDYVAPEITEGRGDALPHYPGLSNEDSRRGLWFVCMPNFAVEVFADQFVVMATHPVAPDETYEELHFFVVGDDAATDAKYARGREELISMWDDLNMEDVELLERLQRGRRSVAFDGSIMSPAWEGPAHELAQQVIRAIERE